MTKELVSELLEKRRVDMTGLVSEKTGKVYDATVLLFTDSEGRARFKPRKYTDREGNEREANDVDKFYDYDPAFFQSRKTSNGGGGWTPGSF